MSSRRPQQLPEFIEHAASFVVPAQSALRLSREERDKAEANEQRREARLWRERQQDLRDDQAERGRRELQAQQRRRIQLEEEQRSKLFETTAVGSTVGMSGMMGADGESADGESADSVLRASSEDDHDDEAPEDRPVPSQEVVRQRIAGRRMLAEAREFAEMGPTMVTAAIAQFEAGLEQLMPLLRGGGPPDPTLSEEVMQAVDAMERLRGAVRAKPETGLRSPAASAPSTARSTCTSPAEADSKRRPRRSEPHKHTAPSPQPHAVPSPTTYAGDGMSQPWISSFNPGSLNLGGGGGGGDDAVSSGGSASSRRQAPPSPAAATTDAQAMSPPRNDGLEFGESLDTLLEFVEELNAGAGPSPLRGARPVASPLHSARSVASSAPSGITELYNNAGTYTEESRRAAPIRLPSSSPIRLPASPRESPTKSLHEHRAEQFRQYIVALYQRVNPGALTELSAVFKRYKGREEELWQTVCRKYHHDPDPDPVTANPAEPVAAVMPVVGVGAAGGGGAAAVRRSMTLEHVDVAPPPSPDLRSWAAAPAAATAAGGEEAGDAPLSTERKINVRLSREAPGGGIDRGGGDRGGGGSGMIGLLQGDDSIVGGGASGADIPSGGSMVLGSSMARWMSREATTAQTAAVVEPPPRPVPQPAAAVDGFDSSSMSVAEAAAAAARSPIQLPGTPVAASPWRGNTVAIPSPGNDSVGARVLPRRLDPVSPHRPPPGRMAYGAITKSAIRVNARAHREAHAARVVQRAWARWSFRANEKAAKWKKELELLRWRITTLRRDGEEIAAQELEAKLVEVMQGMGAVKLRELDRRGDPRRRGGVSAFGRERLDPWHQRVSSPLDSAGGRSEVQRLMMERDKLIAQRDVLTGDDSTSRARHYGASGGTFSDGDDDEGNVSDESHESWKSWRDEGTDAVQERLRVQRAVAGDQQKRQPQQHQQGRRTTREQEEDDRHQRRRQSLSVAQEQGGGKRRPHSARRPHSEADADEQEGGRRGLPFSDEEDEDEEDGAKEEEEESENDNDTEDDYYYNAHDGDIHEFASQLGSFLRGGRRDEQEDSSFYSQQAEAEESGIFHGDGPLDMGAREQVFAGGGAAVGPDALMHALGSLEEEVGVGNKPSFRRAVAVFQLHLGALVSGEVALDGLDTIDQRHRTYDARVGKFPSAKLCLKALGFRKEGRGLWRHEGVRGAVDYGDGYVPRGVAGRMLRLLGMAAERGSAPSAQLCRQLEQQALLDRGRQGGVVPTSRVDTGRRPQQDDRYQARPSGLPDAYQDDDDGDDSEGDVIPPVGWRPPGFSATAVVLKPVNGVQSLLASQRKRQDNQQGSLNEKNAELQRDTHNISLSPAADRAAVSKTTVSTEKLSRLAQPKDKSNPSIRGSGNGINSRLNGDGKQAASPAAKIEARCARQQQKKQPFSPEEEEDGHGGGGGSGIDLTVGAKELTQVGMNQRLFVLRPDAETVAAEPEPVPEPVPAPEPAPAPAAAPSPRKPADLAALRAQELAMASRWEGAMMVNGAGGSPVGVAASLQLIQPRPGAASGSPARKSLQQPVRQPTWEDYDSFEDDESAAFAGGVDMQAQAAMQAAPRQGAGGSGSGLELDLERVMRTAEAAVADAKKKAAWLASGGNSDPEPQPQQQPQQYDLQEDEQEEEEVEEIDPGMPEAFRAGMQAKLSARGSDTSGSPRGGSPRVSEAAPAPGGALTVESVESQARREYEDWLQQRIAASLEPQ